jgi:hypothetical protein
MRDLGKKNFHREAVEEKKKKNEDSMCGFWVVLEIGLF